MALGMSKLFEWIYLEIIRISREILPSFCRLAYILSSWFRDYLYIPLGGKGSK
jgi:D-alanyl-lipoteichoic acid acyltransferase DltB (MBOAT superfamily)